MRILHLVDRFNYCDGCARHLLLLMREQRKAHELRAIAGFGEALGMLDEEGIPIDILRSLLHERRSTAGFLRGAVQLGRAIRTFSPDIVHAHHFYAANLVRWNPLNLRRPLVLTVHGNVTEYGKLQHYLGDRIIAVSRSTDERIRNRRPAVANRVRLVPNASTFLERYDARIREGEEYRRAAELKRNHLVLLFVGRLARMKGFDLLVDAAARLAASRPLLLAAVGEKEPGSDFSIPPALPFLHVSRIPDVRPFYELADLVILPSHSEGMPLSILEAGLMEKCVIASAVDGIPEVIRHEQTGLLVPPGDREALHSALERAAGDPALRNRLGANLRQVVERGHTVVRMAAQVEEIYHELVAVKGRRSAP